jgi:hypothetical protein
MAQMKWPVRLKPALVNPGDDPFSTKGINIRLIKSEIGYIVNYDYRKSLF